ncbi:MAG: GDSL-type esterase/lipase family protein [Planctomycetes bacterium]|nr:GDSL-type esterase/lipase family protein [Planctomycetota bacterium]
MFSLPTHVKKLASLVALWCVACGLVAHAQDAEPADPDPARFDGEIRVFEAWDRQNSWPRDAVLFVGSSTIRMWPTADGFPGLPVINRGFGGSHTSDVNHFTERIVLKYRPRVIVFYAGDNDISDGKSPRQVFEDFRSFVSLVYERLPETQIIYLPIKPSLARWSMWPKMREANALVAALANDNDQIEYVDTATPMLGADGQPRKGLFIDDGLHMNETGYQGWVKILAPVVRDAAGPD